MTKVSRWRLAHACGNGKHVAPRNSVKRGPDETCLKLRGSLLETLSVCTASCVLCFPDHCCNDPVFNRKSLNFQSVGNCITSRWFYTSRFSHSVSSSTCMQGVGSDCPVVWRVSYRCCTLQSGSFYFKHNCPL